MRDMTERRAIEEKLRRQSNEILEMAAVPIVRIWEGILLVPLIGTLDSQRTQQLMERLLHRITETMSQVALLDITGVPTIDTQTAQHLIETISTVRLLGAEPILTGITPIIAQTLVHLGVNMANVATRSSLAAGLRLAMTEEHYRLLAENAPDVILRYEFTPQRVCTFVNPRITALTGYTPEEYCADSDLALRLVHPHDRSLMEAVFRGESASDENGPGLY